MTANDVCRLEWKEDGGSLVTPPTKRGFGSQLIERTIRQGLQGAIEISYAADGFRCSIKTPL